ncbi:MAG TPA: hypothetical protein VFR37_02310 [Longimicrobium sp.]|nr:hypothetical protein [Longimicrobium sp.]
MQEPQYLTTPEGVRWQDTKGRLSPTLQAGLALLYDSEAGVLLKHGEPAHVERFFGRATTALAGTRLAADLEMFIIPLDRLTPALLREVNRAVQISGYITTFVESLKPAPLPPGPA